jgi:hypothetical protein
MNAGQDGEREEEERNEPVEQGQALLMWQFSAALRKQVT